MIVCSCNCLSNTDIDQGWCDLRARSDSGAISPAAVFRCIGHRPNCGGCFPLVAKLIHLNDEAYRGVTSGNGARPSEGRIDDEGKRQGHRNPQRGSAA